MATTSGAAEAGRRRLIGLDQRHALQQGRRNRNVFLNTGDARVGKQPLHRRGIGVQGGERNGVEQGNASDAGTGGRLQHSLLAGPQPCTLRLGLRWRQRLLVGQRLPDADDHPQHTTLVGPRNQRCRRRAGSLGRAGINDDRRRRCVLRVRVRNNCRQCQCCGQARDSPNALPKFSVNSHCQIPLKDVPTVARQINNRSRPSPLGAAGSTSPSKRRCAFLRFKTRS